MYTLVVGADSVRQIVQQVGLNELMDELIDRLLIALREFDGEQFAIPPRAGFDYERPNTGLLEWMPLLQRERQMTIKTVGYHPSNPVVRGCSTILSTVSCYDPASGHLSGIVDGTFLTALRTGAASAVASQVLAGPNSRTLGIIGCGAQAVSQVHALSRVFSLTDICAYDTDAAAANSLSERCSNFLDDPSIVRAETLEDVVRRADILCTCTSVNVGEGPVFPPISIRPHLHINAVGSDFPGKTELPHSILKRALVCPDFRAQAIREGECQKLRSDEIGPDLVELVAASTNYHSHRDSLTVFDSTGWALEDHVAAELLFDYARRYGLGIQIQLESTSDDPRNPYGFVGEVCRIKSHER